MRFLNASVLERKALNRNLSWGFPLGNFLPKRRVLKHRVLERKRRPNANASVLGTQRFRTLSLWSLDQDFHFLLQDPRTVELILIPREAQVTRHRFRHLLGGFSKGSWPRGPHDWKISISRGDISESVKCRFSKCRFSVLNLKFDFISDGGCAREKQIQKALGSLPPCGNRCRFSESAICSSRVHPPSEIKSNFKFKTLRWRPLRWRLTLSEYWKNQAFNTEWNFQSRMKFSFRALLWPQKNRAWDWDFSIENEIFKPRMKISSENENFVRGGMVFFSCVRARMNFFDPGPSGEGVWKALKTHTPPNLEGDGFTPHIWGGCLKKHSKRSGFFKIHLPNWGGGNPHPPKFGGYGSSGGSFGWPLQKPFKNPSETPSKTPSKTLL